MPQALLALALLLLLDLALASAFFFESITHVVFFAAVHLAFAATLQNSGAVGTWVTCVFIVIIQDLSPMDVVKFDVRPPALARENLRAPIVNAAVEAFTH